MDEIKGIKYQISLVTKKRFSPVYFISINKIVINLKYDLDKSFQEILYRIVNWINEVSGWVTESINDEYMNISIYVHFLEVHTLTSLTN